MPLEPSRNAPHLDAMQNDTTQITGKLLLAMPGMGDPRFEHAVIYMCAHSPEGAMGLIINKPSDQIDFQDLLKQLSIDASSDPRNIQVHFGGPVENGRGFVLHSGDYSENDSTLAVDENFGMTATLDILEDLAQGDGPNDSLLALGYSGWGPGQLEEEIQENGWLICDASTDLVFQVQDGDKWTEALTTMGISPLMLSAQAGRA